MAKAENPQFSSAVGYPEFPSGLEAFKTNQRRLEKLRRGALKSSFPRDAHTKVAHG